MTRIPLVWIITFGVFTSCCLGLAAFASGSINDTRIHPHRHDSVVILAPLRIAHCTAGTLVAGTVLAVGGDRMSVSSTHGNQSRAQVDVNDARAATVSLALVESGTLQASQVALVTHQRCGHVLVALPASRVVAYARTTTSARIAVVRAELRQRIDAEKYVAGVYLLVTGMFGMWLFIHAGRLKRLDEQIELVRQLTATQQPAATEPHPHPQSR